MSKKPQSPIIDPLNLLNIHCESAEMRDNFRRDLLTKSREVVASRRCMPLFSWAAGAAGVAVIVTFLVLAWHMFCSVPKNPKAPLRSVNTAKALKAGPQEKDRVKRAPSAPQRQVQKSNDIRRAPQLEKKAPQAHPSVLRHSDEPIVTLVSVQNPVMDNTGRALYAGDRLPAGVSIRTGKGGRVGLITRKGSELYLDSNSEVVFSSKAVANIIQGRLYCSNRNKEIARIDTPAGNVRLLGTVVNTAVIKKDAVAVTVVEGKVELTNQHGSALVDAGRRSVLMAYGPPQAGVPVDTYKEIAWYHGRGDYQSDFGDIAYTLSKNGGAVTEVWVMKADGSARRRVRSFMGYALELGPWMPGERWLSMDLHSMIWNTPDAQRRIMTSGGGFPITDSCSLLLDTVTGQSMPIDLPPNYDPLYKSFAAAPGLVAFCGSYRPDVNDRTKIEGGVWVYDARNDKITRLMEGWIKTPVAWAPDSRYIAVSSGQGYTNDHKLQIIDTQTGEIRDLDIQGAGAVFSPDGCKIAYCGDWKESNAWRKGVPMSGSIFVLDLTRETQPVRVSPNGMYAVEPRWSPNGKRIAYLTPDNEIYVVNVDGSHPREVYREYRGWIFKASWAPVGDALFATVKRGENTSTLIIAADGTGVIRAFNSSDTENHLPADVQKQTDAAITAINDYVYEYTMGNIYQFKGDLDARRRSFDSAAGIISDLVWKYPLAGFGTDDVLRYADASAKKAAAPRAEIIHDICRERMSCLHTALCSSAREEHSFPPDLQTAIKWAGLVGWQATWLSNSDTAHVMMMGTCPGSSDQGPVPFDYTPPTGEFGPNVGDVLLRCPLHPDNYDKWDEFDYSFLNPPPLTLSKQGDLSRLKDCPYYWFENVSSGPTTLAYHAIGDINEVKGSIKLLPVGKVFTNETFRIGPTDEGSIGRAVQAAGKLDWGNLPQDEIRKAERELTFCIGVARVEAKQPLGDLDISGIGKIIDGEPARLLYEGHAGGSCGVLGSNLRIELIGPGDITLYQLKPSGRFRVYGCVRVLKTKQVCRNGWMDKDGNVIFTEK